MKFQRKNELLVALLTLAGAATSIIFCRDKSFCRDKKKKKKKKTTTFIATKMILVAAPAFDAFTPYMGVRDLPHTWGTGFTPYRRRGNRLNVGVFTPNVLDTFAPVQ